MVYTIGMKRKPKDIENQLIEAIRKSEMSTYAICKQSGVDPAALSRFLSGERSLTLPSAAKVVQVLRLELRKMEE